MVENELLVALAAIFAIVFVVIIIQNHLVMRSADKRLSKANEMVLTLAHSADNLTESISTLKDMMIHLEQVYTSRNDALVKNRDEYREAYTALLHKYEALDVEFKTQLKELANRPTIANNNYPTE